MTAPDAARWPPAGPRRRVRARIEGTVQGVGFRPHVFRLVRSLDLVGFVRNDERGVLLEVEGLAEAVERFFARLAAEAPPLARVERIRRREVAPRGDARFAILASTPAREPATPVAPDFATCEACLGELRDPEDRRYRYPFLSCTQCGPRFTILRAVPYDRPHTTMAGFRMCAPCEAEYHDPDDRRFHAQPNACPDCGPRLRLEGPSGGSSGGDEALRDAVAALRAGRILAVKGLGGFHLACRADDARAVAALRERKQRPHKPLALMALDSAAARALVTLSPDDEALLHSSARPILVAPRRPDAPVAPEVAPGASDLGVMLPYTPLHHLLLGDLSVPLVMTSGNRGGEPIAHRDADAVEKLAGIADAFLLHDRPIHARADDSVLRSAASASGAPVLLRRARGYAPESLTLPVPTPRPLLACGADLKNAFCLAKGGRAWVAPHVGDLGDWTTFEAFGELLAHLERLFAVRPEVVVHDLHPGYHTTRFAEEREGVRRLAVQHHHAHLCATLAEHGEVGPAVAAIFDGTGYGTDGTVWGGELLVGGLAGFERAGHLRPVRLPGGERAIREPWRMACAWRTAVEDEPPLPPSLVGRIAPARWRAVAALARSGSAAAPWTTSVGRLFDAVAALCGVGVEASYEGQAALELEALADPRERGAYPLPVVPAAEGPGVRLQLDPRPTLDHVASELAAGVPAGRVSARFHRALARATAEACARLAARHRLQTVVLSGGVFQNRRLLGDVIEELRRAPLRVLVPRRLPPNDGGIAYGQAAAAAWALHSGHDTSGSGSPSP